MFEVPARAARAAIALVRPHGAQARSRCVATCARPRIGRRAGKSERVRAMHDGIMQRRARVAPMRHWAHQIARTRSRLLFNKLACTCVDLGARRCACGRCGVAPLDALAVLPHHRAAAHATHICTPATRAYYPIGCAGGIEWRSKRLPGACRHVYLASVGRAFLGTGTGSTYTNAYAYAHM